MDVSLTLVKLAGYVALLLWGVHMVQTGVQRALGARLRSLLTGGLRNRLSAFVTGLGVTAILQSSTATGLIVTGFAAMGLVELVSALAVMLGANVGSTLIVQLLSFDTAEVAPALILVGVLLFRRASAAPRDFGRVLIGLGLVLMALREFVALLEPFEDMPSLRLLLGAVATEPVVDVILAAGLTWAAHSSVAVVLVVMAFAAKGVVPPHAAFALVLGANLGTAINPVLEVGNGDPAARRVSLGNLLIRLAGIVATLALLPLLGPWIVAIDPDNARAVADFHTGFNLVLALLFLPLLSPVAHLLRRLVPSRPDPADPARPLYLDPAAREVPAIAIGAAAREALRLTDLLETMLNGLRQVLRTADRRQIATTRQVDDSLDKLNAALKAYLVGLDFESLTEGDQQRINQILTFATNLEQAGDVVERNLLGLVSKQVKRGVVLPEDAQARLLQFLDRLIVNVRSAGSVFLTGDERAARLLTEEKAAFRALQSEAVERHFARLKAGSVESADTSALYLDMIRDFKQLNAHLVAASAYPVLEAKQELLPTRLRSPAEADQDASEAAHS